MKERNAFLVNLSLFLVLSILFAAFQTTAWSGFSRIFFGTNIWIVICLYFFIYRNFFHGLVFAYLNTFAVHTFTGMPLGILLSVQIALLALCHALRTRIFWNTVSYFIIVSGLGVFVFNLIFMLFSNLFESVPMRSFPWKIVFFNLLISPLVGLLAFQFFRLVDRIVPPPRFGVNEK